MKREYVMLAKVWEGRDPTGMLCSVKMDGQRAFWDGGVSRGMPKVNIPWANMDKDRRAHTCTGLWSRHGNVIYAPDWWLDKLPRGMWLDGELWMGRGTFQELRSTVGSYTPGSGWSSVRFHLIDVITPRVFFTQGRVGNGDSSRWISEDVCTEWYQRHAQDTPLFRYVPTFSDVVAGWNTLANDIVVPTPQVKVRGVSHVEEMLSVETSLGGEGLILRDPGSVWVPHRVGAVLKVKPYLEGEGVVIGVTLGEGRLAGMVGSLTVKWGDVVFSLSGLTDDERRESWIGRTVSFRYREKTKDGIPKEARYQRQ